MKIENAEKVRSRIRGPKILLDFIKLGYIIYMVRIMSSNATCFMLWVFVFVHAYESYRFEHKARAQGWPRTGIKRFWAFWRLTFFVFTNHTPWLTFTPPGLFVIFFIFFFIFSYLLLLIIFSEQLKILKINSLFFAILFYLFYYFFA